MRAFWSESVCGFCNLTLVDGVFSMLSICLVGEAAAAASVAFMALDMEFRACDKDDGF